MIKENENSQTQTQTEESKEEPKTKTKNKKEKKKVSKTANRTMLYTAGAVIGLAVVATVAVSYFKRRNN